MTPEIKGLLLIAAKVGHRVPAGHHCHTLAALLSIDPEHENHARRWKAGLAVQADGLERALSDLPSQHGGAQAGDQAQRPGDRA